MKKLIMIVGTIMALVLTPFIVNAQDEHGHWEICIRCGGTGSVIISEWDGDYYVETEVLCPVCNGKGYIGEKATSEEEEPTAEEIQPKEEEPTAEEPQPKED